MTRLPVLILASFLAFHAAANGQTAVIATVAGGGSGFGDGGSPTATTLNQPGGVFVDGSGNLFIADTANSRIREVPAGSNIIQTIAGTGCCGYSGDGGLATAAALNEPQGVAVDASGNIYIADTTNNVVRKVSAAGVITTVAGRVGIVGYAGDGGPAVASLLWTPSGVAVDGNGNLFIADFGNNVIREVSASSGNISTVAGSTTQGFGGDGGSATAAAAELYNPTGVSVDASGNIYIADHGNNRIRKVSGGNITTFAGTGTEGPSGDGGPAASAELYNPTGVFVDGTGNVFIADTFNNRIREVSAGNITTVAGEGTRFFSGDGGAATSATLNHPNGVAVDGSGNIFIADTGNNRIREVSASTVPPPSIKSGGVVAVDSTVTTIQAGEWVSIYGANLAGSTATWTGNFQTTLGGTSVTIDGIAAYPSYVSPTQINVQAPNDMSTGSVPVVVKTAVGSSSSTVTLAQFAPSFLLFDSKHVTGIILRANGAYDFLGPTGNSLGYATVAAKAGDTVELYAAGLGPTNPPVQAGQAFSSAAPTTNQVELLINNVTVVTPSFAGFSSSLLYQINLTIPAGLGTGDVPLVATVGGVQTQTGVVISLQ